MKAKDFAHIAPFDGEIERFPDWADRMTAKFGRAHPRLSDLLEWAEKEGDAITESRERQVQGIEGVNISRSVFDVLLERTGPKLFDKRRNAEQGRGLEFWRV